MGVVMQELVTALVRPLRDMDKETQFRYFLMSAIRFKSLASCQQTFMFHQCMKRLESEKRGCKERMAMSQHAVAATYKLASGTFTLSGICNDLWKELNTMCIF